MRHASVSIFIALAVTLAGGEFGEADERLKGIACRSVHLAYPAAEAVAFYNEVKVEQSARGSYFMVCGWDKGYFGIQELGDGKKLVLFSVWDSPQNDSAAVPADQRVKLLHKDEKTRIGRFGGEGTGGQAFYDLDWKLEETYRFVVTAKINGERTEYGGHFRLSDSDEWIHLASFSTITGGRNLRGLYSFVEDFKRDKISTTHARRASFGNGWVLATDGCWTPLLRARFTADNNPAMNIDAGIERERYYLATGGETQNTGAKLTNFLSLPESTRQPTGLPVAK